MQIGMMTLWTAAFVGNAGSVKLLLAAGGDKNAQDKVSVFLDYLFDSANGRLNVCYQCQHGQTALAAASEQGHVDAVKRLLAVEADTNMLDSVRT
jgi:ankyrin repeat protein